MGTKPAINFLDLMESIKNTLQEAFPEFEVLNYDDDAKLTVKTILVALDSFERPENPVPEFFTLSCEFSAYIFIPFALESSTEIKQKAVELAYFIDGNNFGNSNIFKKSKFLAAEPDPFNEKTDDAEIWRVHWNTDIKQKG